MSSVAMFSRVYIYLGLTTLAALVCATPDNTNTAASTVAVIHLAEAQQCPISPKPICSDSECEGSIMVCATRFLCSNQNPFTASDGRSVILAGCRCCPLPIHVWCEDHICAAPEGSHVCVGELLEGCECMTGKDRLAAIEAAAATDHVLGSDVDVEIDFEPSSDEERYIRGLTTATDSTHASMATMAVELFQQPLWSMQRIGLNRC